MISNVRFLNPPTISKPPGYTQVVDVTAPGRIVYIAGQLGLDAQGHLVGGPGNARAQIKQAFENLKSALAAVGVDFPQVVKVNNYLTDMTHMPVFREIRDCYLNSAAPPASTTVGVTQLAREGALFEIEAVAILPS